MAQSIEMQNPEVRKLWWITLVVQSSVGLTFGLYLYTYGPFFYEKFGGSEDPKTAMLLTTVLLGIRQGLVALLEVPTGAIADAIGRVHTVILSWIFRVLFFVFLAIIWFCHSVPMAFAVGVLASIAFAFSYTMFNGAFSAWCAETLREKAPEVSYAWLSSRFYSYNTGARMVGGAIAVLLALKGLTFVDFFLAAFISFCGMGYSIQKMKEVKSLSFINIKQVQFSTITRRIGEIIGRASQTCARTPVLFWIILTFGNYLFLLNLVEYLWPVFLKEKFGSAANFGYMWLFIVIASQSLAMISSRILVRLHKYWTKKGGVEHHIVGFRRLFVAAAIISAASILLFSWQTAYHTAIPYVFPLAVIVVILSFGILGPCFETLLNFYIPPADAQERATIMSAGSMLRSVLILILAIPAGGSSGQTSPIGWAIPAILLLVSTLVANRFMKRAQQKRDEISAYSVVVTE